MKNFIKPILAASLLAVSVPAMALTGSQEVLKETIISEPDGTQRVVLEPTDLVIPGEKLVYKLNYENDDAKPATDLVMVMPVPKVVTYLEGTANGQGSQIAYSVDDGRSYGARETLSVVNPDGTVRTASADDITHIRWTIAGPVAPGSRGSLVFKGTLK